MTPEERLAELGLVLPPVPAPVASYVPATIHGDMAYSSGQLPMLEGRLMATGKVGLGGHVAPARATECARIAALNALAAVAQVAGGINNIDRIVRVVGYVDAGDGFRDIPGVVNGASDLLTAIFGDRGVHARSAIGASSLPLGAPVEIEIHAALVQR